MAIFDPGDQRMCVRIVYDGVGGAGKTTNLRQLCASFATQRATELYSPGEADGHTLYFDWTQIAAGVICGFPLMCQIVSVPGQVVLSARRRHLLETADVVVYVCDSSASGLGRARASLRLIASIARDGRKSKLPLVLQANKQDQADALDGATLGAALDLADVPVIEAIASDGIGVVDTFVAAVRAVSRRIQDQVAAGALRIPVQASERSSSLLKRLERVRVDPEWAAEMLLEEAHAEMLIEGRPTLRASAPLASPMLPRADVPPGFIWPGHTGRPTLARLVGEAEKKRGGCAVDADGRVRVTIEGWTFATSADRRFAESEAARQALVRAARAQTQLEGLGVPETVLAAQAGTDDAWWVWTVTPALSTVAARVAEGARELVRLWVPAIVTALRVGLRHGFTPDFAPGAYAEQGGVIRYVGRLGEPPAAKEALAASMSAAIEEVVALGVQVGEILDVLERALARGLTPDELGRTVSAFATASQTGPASERIHELFTRMSLSA